MRIVFLLIFTVLYGFVLLEPGVFPRPVNAFILVGFWVYYLAVVIFRWDPSKLPMHKLRMRQRIEK